MAMRTCPVASKATSTSGANFRFSFSISCGLSFL
jgi:hypothetical protein